MNKPKKRRTAETAEYLAALLPALQRERDRLRFKACDLQSQIMELEGRAVKGAFGRNVQKYRELFGWSQLELAESLGICRSMVTHIENGRHTTMEHLLKLCKIFKVTPDDLLL